MKLGCLLPILAIGFIMVGAEGLYVGLMNRTLTTMTYQEFLQKKPSSGWIEISDARLNLLTAIHESNRFTGTIKKVYLPVGSSAAGEHVGDDNKIHLLLVTEDETILNTVKGLESATGGGGGLMGRLNRRIEANRKPEAKKTEPPAKDDALKARPLHGRERRQGPAQPAGSRVAPVRPGLRQPRQGQDSGARSQHRNGFCGPGGRRAAATGRLSLHDYCRDRARRTAYRQGSEGRTTEPAGFRLARRVVTSSSARNPRRSREPARLVRASCWKLWVLSCGF